MKNPTNDLLLGRRSIEELEECFLLEDWKWDKKLKVWFFKFSVENKNSNNIPKFTNWYLTADDDYPNGKINIYPSHENSIRDTYFHQSNNGTISENNLWRNGKLCLDLQGVLEGFIQKTEPTLPYQRMLWHLLRTIEWIKEANSDTLIKKGEFMEFPHFFLNHTFKVVFSEDLDSGVIWNNIKNNIGYADICLMENNVFLIKKFFVIDGKVVNIYKWGKDIEKQLNNKESEKALWIKIPKPLVLNKWQAPNTWGDLKKVFKSQEMNLLELIEKLSSKIRDKKQHFLLIGFPFQERLGDDKYVYHWVPLLLSTLSTDGEYANGFRKNEIGWFEMDKKTKYNNELPLNWVESENWSSYSILSRGQYNKSVREKKYIIIGAGTLSAYLSEQLVRNGIEDITIIDDDIYKIGNNCRHTLNFEDVGKFKAESLANRLNKTNPHAKVKNINLKLDIENIELLMKYDIIIDCSANDEVILNISNYKLLFT